MFGTVTLLITSPIRVSVHLLQFVFLKLRVKREKTKIRRRHHFKHRKCILFMFYSSVISRAPGLKLVVETLMSSLKPIGNIVVICCAFFIIFGILGVQVRKAEEDPP